VALAALCALVILAAGFPAAGLLSQHQQQSAASAQLAQLRIENTQLAEQQRALNSKTEINRLARQLYQLVSPGETLYDVLPAAGKRTSTAPGGVEADPGDQPLVSPSNAPDMSPDPGLPQAASPPPTASSSSGTRGSGSSSSAQGVGPNSPSSFWGRVANTLEFWQ
jgi:cell division protein FtsB